jgi:hypothetical protein
MTERATAVEPTLQDVERRLRRLEDERSIRDLVVRMGTLADARDWSALADLFTDPVRADWSELSGVPAADLRPTELVKGWRQALSGLDATHHLIANHEIEITADGSRATARAYVHAAHRLANAYGDSVWIIAGRYEHRLGHTDAGWRIAAATVHPLWGAGNRQVRTLASDATG